MKFLALTLLVLVAVVSARNFNLEDVINVEENTAFGYLSKYGAPLAEKIRKAEEEGDQNPSRIVGGAASSLGQFPYQVISIKNYYFFLFQIIKLFYWAYRRHQ